MKKYVFIIVILLGLLINAHAISDETEEIFDATGAEKILDIETDVFESFNTTEFVRNLFDGEAMDVESVFTKIVKYIFRSFRRNIRLCLAVVGICYIMGLYSNFQNELGGKGVSQAGYVVFYCVLAGVLSSAFVGISEVAGVAIENTGVMIKSLMPILITLLTTSGGVISGSLLASVLILLANIVLLVIETIVLPLIYCSFAMSLAANMSERIKLTKTVPFLHKIIKWLLLFTMVAFSSLFGIYGMSGYTMDATTGKLVRFAIGTSVPIVGGVAADSFEAVLSTLAIARNLVGISGVVAILVTLLGPFLETVVIMWIFKLCAVVVEPFSDSRTVKLLTDASECITMLFSVLISVALIFIGGIGIVLVTGNFVLR